MRIVSLAAAVALLGCGCLSTRPIAFTTDFTITPAAGRGQYEVETTIEDLANQTRLEGPVMTVETGRERAISVANQGNSYEVRVLISKTIAGVRAAISTVITRDGSPIWTGRQSLLVEP